MKLSLILVLAFLAVTLAEPKVPQRGVIHQIRRGVAGPNPYIFLTIPQGRSQALVQGFEVIDDEDDGNNDNLNDDNDERDTVANDDADDDENEDNQQDDDNDEEEEIKDNMPKNEAVVNNNNNNNDDDDADDDDEEEFHDVMNMKLQKPNVQIKNAQSTQMMVSREHAGALMVPDQIIEIEGQSVIDEKTGKPALLLPRAILDSIPDGSVVALMERSDEDTAEERANRVIVRRRRKGSRRNVKRRRGSNNVRRRVNKRRGGGNNRRRVNKRKNVRVVRGGNRRRNNRRKTNRRRVNYQG